MTEEMWDVYDGDCNPIGKTTLRGRCSLAPGEYHLVVHIWILSKNGTFLIQRRADDKKLMPGEWAATGGAVIAGEDSYTAANRELFEELGIRSDRETLKKLVRIKRRNSFIDVWAITADVKTMDLTLQKSEVAEARWVDKPMLINMINKGVYHNYGNEYFETVFKKIDEFIGVNI